VFASRPLCKPIYGLEIGFTGDFHMIDVGIVSKFQSKQKNNLSVDYLKVSVSISLLQIFFDFSEDKRHGYTCLKN